MRRRIVVADRTGRLEHTASCALCGDGANCTDAGPDADIMIAPVRMRMHRNRASLRDIIG